MMKDYQNSSGYKIKATEKAYKLFYEKQGFKPVKETEQAKQEKPLEKWTITELKKALEAAKVPFEGTSGKGELMELYRKVLEEEKQQEEEQHEVE